MIVKNAVCAVFLVAMMVPSLGYAGVGKLQLPSFKPLPNDRTLVQNSVQDMVQDSEGFLWIATLGGLHRFDGIEMVLINDIGTAETKFNILQVTAVAVAPSGDIWTGGAMSELARISASNQAIENFAAYSSGFGFGKDTTVRQIKIQPSGVVWIKNDVALVKFDPGTQKFEKVEIGFPDGWGSHRFFRIELLDDENLIIHNQTNIGILNLESLQVSALTDSKGKAIPAGTVSRCERVRDGSLWTCGTAGQIGRIDATESGYQLKMWQTPTESHFTGISMDLDGYIWLTVDRWEVKRWCPAGNFLEDVGLGIEQHVTSEMRPIRRLFNDRSGVMWIGTESFGLLRVDPSAARFGNIRKETATVRGFQDPYLWDIKEDEQGLIIAGRSELGRLSLDNGEYRRILDESFYGDSG